MAKSSTVRLKSPWFDPVVLWKLTYHDGSNNTTVIQRDSLEEQARFEYRPMTPERSSSGTYSGGEPSVGVLSNEQLSTVLGQIEILEANEEIHTGTRSMGTGSFSITDVGGERSFIVRMGSELRALDEFLTGIRSL